MEIFDANGNKVTENTAVCTTCGAHIKHVFIWDGKPYGSTCIEAVSGISPTDWVDGDEQKTRKSLAAKAQANQERAAKSAALNELRESIRQANRAEYAELITVLNNASRYEGDFCSEMAKNIGNDGFSRNLNDILSYRQFNIVRDIYGKAVGGRSNSKAYNIAVEEFDRKFCKEIAA
jgi:hypothetical protein